MAELGPDEGINRLRHPDCRACKESERVNVGLLAENTQLKKKLRGGGAGSALAQVIADIERQMDGRIDPAAHNAYLHCLGMVRGLAQPTSDNKSGEG